MEVKKTKKEHLLFLKYKDYINGNYPINQTVIDAFNFDVKKFKSKK